MSKLDKETEDKVRIMGEIISIRQKIFEIEVMIDAIQDIIENSISQASDFQDEKRINEKLKETIERK